MFIVAAIATSAALLWWSVPPRNLVAQLPGLAASARVTFDADGIPLVRAGSERDAAVVLGFVHARDRMFQMDLTQIGRAHV